MIEEINGKKILFFSPAFFGYENMIANKMREMGAVVDFYDERSVTDAFQRAILKISPSQFNKKTHKYYEKILEANKKNAYDYIFIIKCDMTPISILKRFRELYPYAKLCLYLWDSLENSPGLINKLKFFDTIHSFDPADCEKHSELSFCPLFFGDQFRKELEENKKYKYDISFLGTLHTDRFAVIKQVQTIAKKQGLKCFWFMYLQSRFIFLLYKVTKKEFKNAPERIFSYEKMSAEDIAKVVDESRIILDIQCPKQTGLTMRTIEMIGMNKKLITTNASIKLYDFYNPNNIAIVDRNRVRIPITFLKTPYCPLPNEIYEKYSLNRWIIEVLS